MYIWHSYLSVLGAASAGIPEQPSLAAFCMFYLMHVASIPANCWLPCWTLARQVMPELHLTHWYPLLCNDWPAQFCFTSRKIWDHSGYILKLALAKVKYMWKHGNDDENKSLHLHVLNEEWNSCDIGKNGQFLTLVIILLQEYVWLAVSAKWVLDFLKFH